MTFRADEWTVHDGQWKVSESCMGENWGRWVYTATHKLSGKQGYGQGDTADAAFKQMIHNIENPGKPTYTSYDLYEALLARVEALEHKLRQCTPNSPTSPAPTSSPSLTS